MHDQILNGLPPATQNNARMIVRNSLTKYAKTKANYFAQMVEDITGHYPDSPLYRSASEFKPGNEDELILESLTDDKKIF